MTKRAIWSVPAMLILLCACQRVADPTPTRSPAESESPDQAADTQQATSAVPVRPVSLPLLSALPPSAQDPGGVVRHYAVKLLKRDTTAADAAWMVPPPPGRADDAALRELRDVLTLRVDTQSPLARDQQQPSHLIEVPVRVRAVTSTGTLRYTGWYRLVPDTARNAWLIHSASLQPVLD